MRSAGSVPACTRQGDTDFYFVRCEDPEQCLRRAIEFMTTRIPRKFGLDPLEDVQVLTPMRRNLLGTENLNFELQKALNPTGPALVRGGTTFEYPAVIVIVHTQHYVMLQRNLLYTAITRGKKLVLLIGVPYAVSRAIETNVVRERRTSLAERLRPIA